MLRTNYRCVQSANISVDVAKCGQNSNSHPVHSLYICYRKWHVLTEKSIHVMFQLMRMSSYAKNKLQMCSVSQNECRRRQMWANFHKFTLYTHFLSVSLVSIHCNVSTHENVLRTNHRCVQSPNMSVDVAKCGEIFLKFTQYIHILSVTKKLLVLTEQSIHGNFSTH